MEKTTEFTYPETAPLGSASRMIGSIHLKGDIVITDPCYIISDNIDWETTNYGKHLDKININEFITQDTIYGDWLCEVYDEDENTIGEFAADAGLVTVCRLEDILNYNPGFEKWAKDHDWCATIIRDFEGTIEFIRVDADYVYLDDWYLSSGKLIAKKGKTETSSSLYLKCRDGNITFTTRQIG